MRHEPALDGIRALAVIAVLMFHQGGVGAPAGFLGVDVFFVLSGFLITSLLVIERRDRDRIDLRAFWGRRARRLGPALLLALLLVAAYAMFAAAPSELRSIRGDGLAALLYVENWRQMFAHRSYFATVGVPSPLQHCWSLAIEEQWYLIWPVAVVLLSRRGVRLSRLLLVTSLLAAVSVALTIMLYRSPADVARVYYGTDTRAQALLIGAALGLLVQWRGFPHRAAARTALDICGCVGFAVLVVLVARGNDSSQFWYRGGLTLAAVASAAVVAAAVLPDGQILRRALAWRPLVAVGLLSYGIYLFHWPVFLWLAPSRIHQHGVTLFVIRVTVTAVIAVASYFVVEMPVRRANALRRIRARVWVPVAAGATVALLVVSTAGANSAGARFASAPTARSANAPPMKRVLVVGDSVAFSLAFTDTAAVRALGLDERNGAIVACGIAGGRADRRQQFGTGATCDTWSQEYARSVAAERPELNLLVVGAWETLDHHRANGQILRVGTPEYRSLLFSRLDTAKAVLTRNGARLVIALPPFFDVRYNSDTDYARYQDDRRRISWVKDVLNSYATEHHIATVDFCALLCPNGQLRTRIDGVEMRPDGMHFTQKSAVVAWRWLAPQLEALGVRG